MTSYCYLNLSGQDGKIVSTNDAHISISDIGLLRGYGVFELLRTYHGKPFHFKEHYKRFVASAKALGLRIPVSENTLKSIIKTLLVKNKFPESNIRIVLTGGKTINGMEFDKKNPTFIVLIEPLHEMPKSVYTKGVKLITHQYQREFPRAKTLNYLTAVSLGEKRKKAKAFEVLYTKEGNVLEASTSNIFIFRKGKLSTPKDDILIGVTRNCVLTLAQSAYDVDEKTISMKDLLSADEVFITATNKAIIPVVQIDGKKIGSGKVGKHTRYLMDMFAHYTLHYTHD